MAQPHLDNHGHRMTFNLHLSNSSFFESHIFTLKLALNLIYLQRFEHFSGSNRPQSPYQHGVNPARHFDHLHRAARPRASHNFAAMSDAQPYVTIRARQPVSGIGSRHAEPAVRYSWPQFAKDDTGTTDIK